MSPGWGSFFKPDQGKESPLWPMEEFKYKTWGRDDCCTDKLRGAPWAFRDPQPSYIPVPMRTDSWYNWMVFCLQAQLDVRALSLWCRLCGSFNLVAFNWTLSSWAVMMWSPGLSSGAVFQKYSLCVLLLMKLQGNMVYCFYVCDIGKICLEFLHRNLQGALQQVSSV